MLSNIKLAIIGLGYVGLPLANEFGKKIKEVGENASAKLNDVKGALNKEPAPDQGEKSTGFNPFANKEGGRRKSKKRRSKKRTGRKSKRRTGRKGKKRVRFSKRR
jgi:hypothetical protein